MFNEVENTKNTTYYILTKHTQSYQTKIPNLPPGLTVPHWHLWQAACVRQTPGHQEGT